MRDEPHCHRAGLRGPGTDLVRLAMVTGSFLAALAGAPSASLAEEQHWTVRRGEAISMLATRFGVSVSDLREWNQLRSDRIYIGQRLIVEPSAAERTTYQVVRGDTLGGIAARFGVTVEDLTEWNEGLMPDRIVEGQELQLGRPLYRLIHRVSPGETLLKIALRFGVTPAALRDWNPRLRRSQVLPVGMHLRIFSSIPESTSASVGLPYNGHLEDGIEAQPHPGYVLRDRNRAFGTHETIRWLTEAFDVVRHAHPDAPRPRLHDISARTGGFLAGHRSHQSGRDVDLSFFLRRGCSQEEGCPMLRANPHDLLIAPQWTLLQYWLERDLVEAVFVDESLHQALYEEAKRRGADRGTLSRWFRYPDEGATSGIIRHYPQHRDHLHVRFRCHDSDEACR